MNFGFGKSATKTTTTVKPSKEVESILRRVSQQVINQAPQEFLEHQYAGFSPQQEAAINNLQQSGQLRQVAGMLSPRLQQGITQLNENNAALQREINNGADVGAVNKQAQTLRGGLQQTALNQGLAGTTGALSNNAAVRRGLKNQSAYLSAHQANDPTATNIAARMVDQANAARLSGLGLQSDLAGGNIGLGVQGVGYSNDANTNAFRAAVMQQQNAQAQAQNQWQNANAKTQWPFEQLKTKAAMLDKISPMAGYTLKETNPGISNAQGLLGTGIAAAGTLANSYFAGRANPTALANANAADTAKAYNTLDFAGVDTPANYQTNMNNVRAAANLNQNGFWGTVLNGAQSLRQNQWGGW